MPSNCHFRMSLIFASVFAVVAAFANAQEPVSVQKLFERGALDEVVQRAESERDNPESTYLAAQALIKKEDNGRASEEYGRLKETSGDEAWKAIGESGAELLAGNTDAAMAAATRAIEANADHPFAHYQLGQVASRQQNFKRAAEAFGRAVQLKPDFAYAHYYAGLANNRIKQIAKMSDHLETFLRLAPEAPERAAVMAILRTLRG
jgi:tetratricopeptide (TPR) repeat protein